MNAKIYYRITVPEKEYQLLELAVETLLRLKLGQLEKVVVEEIERRGHDFKFRKNKARKSLRQAQRDLRAVINGEAAVVSAESPQLHQSVSETYELLKRLRGLPDNPKTLETKKDIEDEQEKIYADEDSSTPTN